MRVRAVFFRVLCTLAGCIAVASLTACLGPQPNRNPTAAFLASSQAGYAPLTVELDARASRDSDGDPLTYEWTFDSVDSASGAVVVRTFYAGTHTVELHVSDNRGGADIETGSIAVQAVPEGYVARSFAWTAKGVPQTCTFLIPWDLYQMYKGRIRNTAAESYVYGDYVVDPLDDPTIEDYAGVFWARTDSVEAFVNYALAFVQGAIRYRPDPTRQEWPWYPLETLVAGEGDCEDSAVLFVSLLRARGVSSSLAFADTNSDRLPDHVLALVPVSEPWAARLACSAPLLLFDGVRYAVAETASDGLPIPLGCDPWGLSPEDVFQVWPF
jgi:transglutaminase-like putative cysteine protease